MDAPWWFPFGAVAEVHPTDLAGEMAGTAAPLLIDARRLAGGLLAWRRAGLPVVRA